MNTRFTVLVADGHPLFLFAIAQSLTLRPELELAGEERTGSGAIATLRELRPDLAVLDAQLPELSGLDILRLIRRERLGTRVLVLAATLRPGLSYELVEAGAAGVLSKDAVPRQIADALVGIAHGESVLAPEVQRALIEGVRRTGSRSTLSRREVQVLNFLAGGLTAPQIAAELELSPSTIKTHLKRLYERLEVSDRAAAVAEGMRRGIIE